MAGESVDPGHAVGRRILNSKHVVRTDGKIRVLWVAFEDIRGGGLSLDVLWAAQAGPRKKSETLARANASAAAEGHAVVAWATFMVKDALKQKMVESIVHSETLTNPRHADLNFDEALRVADHDSRKHAEKKAWALAKLMAEFHWEHGTCDYPATA